MTMGSLKPSAYFKSQYSYTTKFDYIFFLQPVLVELNEYIDGLMQERRWRTGVTSLLH